MSASVWYRLNAVWRRNRHSCVTAALVAVAVAIVVFVSASAFRGMAIIGSPAQEAFDVATSLLADRDDAKTLKTPFALIGLDEAAYQTFGNPDHTPRDKLAQILLQAASARPKMMVLDIDITRAESDDTGLEGALEQIGRMNVPLLLVAEPFKSNAGLYTLQHNPFDVLVDRYPSLHWVVANAPGNQGGLIRRMRLWVPICHNDRIMFTPSVALQAALVSQGTSTGPVPAHPVSCTPAAHIPSSLTLAHSLQVGPENVTEVPRDMSIRYSMRWSGETAQISRQYVKTSDGRERPLFVLFPVLHILDPSSGDGAKVWMKNSIVVIGATAPSARDMHQTPLGAMPGMFIVVNAMRGLLDFGLKDGSVWFLELGSLVVISLLTAMIVTVFPEHLSGWLELFLPVPICAVWWVIFTVVLGSGQYFALSLVQLVVAGVFRFVRGKERPKRKKKKKEIEVLAVGANSQEISIQANAGPAQNETGEITAS
jgi:CHASE2 domain-containing sensor protein